MDDKIGKTFSAVELCLEAARTKTKGDFRRFNRIYPVLINIRPTLESELLRKGMGMKPTPIEVLDKLLVPMHGEMLVNKTQTEWAVKVLKEAVN